MVIALFDAIRDLPDADARRRVEQHPSEAVRREVLEMLDADRKNDSPLRTIVDVDGTIDKVHAAPEIPAMVGEYRVTGLLGQGGGGIVLRGTCPKSGDTVAIKVLGIGAWSSRALGRFRQEIKLLGHLSHPGIAKILDAGTDRSGLSPHPYFVMEFVDGRSFSEWRRAKQRTPHEIVALFARIVEAVAYSHARGITHRDLKPSNILVTSEGQPKVLDFGVATVARESDPSLDPLRTLTMLLQFGGSHHGDGTHGGNDTRGGGGTAEGGVVGTLPYMSPEQISGTQVVDARSDLYALGVMLYEALSGRLPYDLSAQSLTDAALVIRSEVPTTLGRHDRGLRGDLEVIVSRLLEKRPVDRYQSAQQLLEDLGRYLSGQRTRVRRLPWHVRTGRFVKRYPVYSSVSAALALVALAAIGYAGVTRADARARERQVAIDETTALRSNLSAAASAVARGQPTAAATFAAAVPEARREWSWHALNRFLGTGRVITRVFYGVEEFAPRGERLFYNIRLYGCSVLEDGLRRMRTMSDFESEISPDGSAFVALGASDGFLVVQSTADGSVLDVVESPVVNAAELAWTTDSRGVVVVNAMGRMALVELASKRVRRIELGWGAAGAEGPMLAASDRFAVAVQHAGSELAIVALDDGGGEPGLRVVPIPGISAVSLAVAVADGGTYAVIGTERGSLEIVDLERGVVARSIKWGNSPIRAVAVDDARGLVVAGGRELDERFGTIGAWDLETGEILGTLGAANGVYAVAFSQDGERLFVAEGNSDAIRAVDVERELLTPTVGGGVQAVSGFAFVDSETLLLARADGFFRWNWSRDPDGRVAKLDAWPLPSDASRGGAFAVVSPDGGRTKALAIVDADARAVRIYSEAGGPLAEVGIDGDARTDGDGSTPIAATRDGFLLGIGRTLVHYGLASSADGRLAIKLLGESALPADIESLGATEGGRRAVATVFGSRMLGIDVDSGRFAVAWDIPAADPRAGRSCSGAITPDGRTAVSVSGDADLSVYEASGGFSLFVAGDFAPWNIDRPAVDVRFSPDGRALAVRFADGTVRVIESSAPREPAGRTP